MDAIVADLEELLQQDLIVQAGTLDKYGTFTAAGAALNVKCRVVEKTTSVRLSSGEEVPSRARVYCGVADVAGTTLALTEDKHRYTLPVGSVEPRAALKALVILRPSDENGPHHHVVYF